MVLPEGIYKTEGAQPGKSLLVLGGVHGNEPCGIELIRNVLPAITIERGTLYYGIGNPRAVEEQVRQTEMNLNRAFRPAEMLTDAEVQSYERKRAESLMPLITSVDALLDIHSAGNFNTTPFVICGTQSFEFARHLPFPVRSSGWDDIEPGGTEYLVNKEGKHGICVECGQHKDPQALERAVRALHTFLVWTGAVSGDIPPENKKQREILVHTIYHTKTNFAPAQDFADFEPVRKGQVLGVDGTEEVCAHNDGVIIFAQPREYPQEEAFIIGKEV